MKTKGERAAMSEGLWFGILIGLLLGLGLGAMLAAAEFIEIAAKGHGV